ncbi:MAG: hypothetical protein ABIQ17_02345 [Candidatus Limnocylindrales bacterium]
MSIWPKRPAVHPITSIALRSIALLMFAGLLILVLLPAALVAASV